MDTETKPLIAFAHYGSVNDISGVTTWLEKLICRMHQDGFRVALYLHHLGSDPFSGSLYKSLSQLGIPIVAEKRKRFLEDDVLATLKFINEYKPSIFLPQCLEAHYHAASIAGKSGLPWIMIIHSDDPAYWALARNIPPSVSNGTLVGVSKHICDKVLQQELSPSIIMIPYGVDIPDKFATFSCSPFRVVYCGRLVEEQKRVSLVIKSMVKACKDSDKIECWIIGDGGDRHSLHKYVQSEQLCHRIQFLGRISQNSIQDVLLESQALLLMSDYEGLPIAVMEAMSVGVVPIVRNIPSGIPELVQEGKTGILVDADPNHAAKAIISLSEQKEKWEALSACSRQLIIDKYSSENSYDNWLNVLHQSSSQFKLSYPIPIPEKINLPSAVSIYERTRHNYLPLKQKILIQLISFGLYLRHRFNLKLRTSIISFLNSLLDRI